MSRTLLVPGTGGTQLIKANGESIGHPKVIDLTIWLLDKAGRSTEKYVALLSMEHAPGVGEPVRTTLAEGENLCAGDCLTVAYNQVVPWIDAIFSYDWRGDLEYNAALLLDYLEKNRPAKGKWKLVAHSQGGLVCIVASKLYAMRNDQNPAAFSDLVSHLCMVGTPVAGTLNAAHALAVGEDLGEAATDEFKQIAGTWPALYQMLPDWLAVRTPEGAHSPYGLFHAETWSAYPWIQVPLLQRAWQIRKRYLREAATCLGGVKYCYVLTTNRPTWNHVVLGADGKLEFPARDRAGDSLVPYKVTSSRVSSSERHRIHLIGPEENTPEHSMLLVDDYVASLVRKEFGA